MNKTFTLQEQEELNKASNALNLDAETKKLACSYLLEYKQKTKQILPERLPVMIGSSILAAAKSQVLTTVNGDTIRGVGISITQLLRGLEMCNLSANMEEFLMGLKDFITIVTLAHDISVELKAMIDKFAFSYTFYVKFNALYRQLELDHTMGEHEEYLRCLKNFGWLVYVNARASVLQSRTELIESVFLLAANLTNLIYNMPKEIALSYFEKNGKKIINAETQKKDEKAIREGILELLKLNNNSAEDVIAHQKSLNELLKKFLENGVLRSSQGLEVGGIFDPQLLFSNFEKLDAYYQKKLGFDDLDERFFFTAKKNVNAGMFTPFAKQGSANKLSININITKSGDLSQSIKKVFPQPKMLNYDVTEQVSMRSNLHEIRFANKTVPASPFAKLPPATPVTRALEMYNWLSDKVRLRKNNTGLTPALESYLSVFDSKFKDEILNRANSLVEKVLNFEKESPSKTNIPLNEKKINDKQNQMVSLYFRVLEELLGQEERKTRSPNFLEILSNENFHKALIACSIESVFFVNNSSSISFAKLLEICDIQAFEFWRIIGSFAKFDPNIPLPIKRHLHSIELRILMCLAWRNDSAMHKLIKKFIEESKIDSEIESPTNATEGMHSPASQPSQQEVQLVLTPQKSTSGGFNIEISPTLRHQPKTELTHSQELFFKRVLHHTALIVYQLTDLLGINEKTAEQVWNVMKYILSSETTLLIDRHIDQLILCSIYGVSKVMHHNLKFQDIIAKYQELPSFDKTEFIENIHQVYITETERADLIKFYNTVYISQMKTYLFALSPQSIQSQVRPGTPQVKKPLVPALVTDSPLREALPYQPPMAKNMSAHNKSGTPMAKYGMTPRTGALYAFGESPSRALETINNFASKRQINFDDSHENSNSGDFIMKKAKTSSILDKIIEQRGEDSESESNKLPASKKTLFGSFPAQSSGVSKFGSYEESATTFANPNTTSSSLSTIRASGFAFPQLQIRTIPNKMSVETPEQPAQQSQSSDEDKGEQGGFKKVQKKEGTLIPEFKL